MNRKYRIFFICIVLVLYSAGCLKDRAGASTVEFPLDVEYSGGSGDKIGEYRQEYVEYMRTLLKYHPDNSDYLHHHPVSFSWIQQKKA